MKTLFNSFWVGNYMGSIETTLFQLDAANKTRYSRRKKQEGLLELASREAHEKKMTYYATILNDDDTPYCAIRSDGGYFGIDFLKEDLENYLIYIYRSLEGQRLLLKQIMLRIHDRETLDVPYTINLNFHPNGEMEIVRFFGGVGAWDNTFEKLKVVSEEELALLWIDYPEFGKYEELIRLDRIPQRALDIILEVTDREFPRFREYLARDREQYRRSES